MVSVFFDSADAEVLKGNIEKSFTDQGFKRIAETKDEKQTIVLQTFMKPPQILGMAKDKKEVEDNIFKFNPAGGLKK